MKKLIVSLIFFIYSLTAQAVSVSFDPQNYQGDYQVLGYSGIMNGTKTMELSQGPYYLLIGALAPIRFDVYSNGALETSNPLALEVNNSTIVFKNSTLNILPNQYTGDWRLPSVTGTNRGPKTGLTIVPNHWYLLQVGPIDALKVFVASNGEVAQVDRPDAITFQGQSISFNTTSIGITSANYKGGWRVPGLIPMGNEDIATLNLVSDVSFRIQISTIGHFDIKIDQQGQGSVDSESSAHFIKNKLVFKTIPVQIQNDTHENFWLLSGLTLDPDSSTDFLHLVPGINYRLVTADGDYKDFNIGDHCQALHEGFQLGSSFYNIGCATPAYLACKKPKINEQVLCRGHFVARSKEDLEDYLSLARQGHYPHKHVVLNFDYQGRELVVDTPCAIKIRKKTTISVQNLCLSSGRRILARPHVSMEGDKLFISVPKNRIRISRKANIDFEETQIFQRETTKKKRHGHGKISKTRKLVINSQ